MIRIIKIEQEKSWLVSDEKALLRVVCWLTWTVHMPSCQSIWKVTGRKQKIQYLFESDYTNNLWQSCISRKSSILFSINVEIVKGSFALHTRLLHWCYQSESLLRKCRREQLMTGLWFCLLFQFLLLFVSSYREEGSSRENDLRDKNTTNQTFHNANEN